MDRGGSDSLTAAKYALAVCAVGTAVGLNLLLTRKVEPSAAPLLFAAVLIAAWKGGWGPGLLATMLASLADDYFFIPPRHTFNLSTVVLTRLAVFLTVALLTSYLTSQRERLLVAERRARGEAEEANRLKDRFLAVTSHELRTPLNAIVMWADVIAQENSGTSQNEGVDIIRTNASALTDMIDELLDVSRITSGKLRLDLSRVDLRETVGSAVDTVRPVAEAKRVELSVSIPDTGNKVLADQGRIRQVVMNLLTNALKFTPEGGKIETTLRSQDGFAELSVRDNGRGMDAQDLPHIFERFWQANGSGQQNGEGLGLGLAIAQDLIGLHGGTIRAESPGVGLGMVFTVTLPLYKPNCDMSHRS